MQLRCGLFFQIFTFFPFFHFSFHFILLICITSYERHIIGQLQITDGCLPTLYHASVNMVIMRTILSHSSCTCHIVSYRRTILSHSSCTCHIVSYRRTILSHSSCICHIVSYRRTILPHYSCICHINKYGIYYRFSNHVHHL